MLNESINKEIPFEIDHPVSSEYFKGRKKTIEEINNFIPMVLKGKPQHFFISGKRGMGKTSLAKYLLDIFERKYKIVGIHLVNDGIHDIDSLITLIVESILNKIESESWSDKLISMFKEHIESIGFMNTTIKFRPNKKYLEVIKDNFPSFLKNLTENFQDKEGLMIVIDDINGLSQNPYFANWFKSFADTLYTKDYEGTVPVSFILTGYPEKLDNFYNHNPSFSRIFKHHILEKLSDEEVESFYLDIFDTIGVNYDKNALNTMVYYSNGMPNMMQEIGGAVFWFIDENNYIGEEIALNGIIEAGNHIRTKYLRNVLNDSIQEEIYLNLFIKIAEYIHNSKYNIFAKKKIIDTLNEEELEIFDEFIRKSVDLNIFTVADLESEEYKFTDNLYINYFLIQKLKN